MYRGKSADSRETAGHLKEGLNFEGAIADIRAAARALKARGYEKVGLTGFCMGGALTIAAATKSEEFAAAVPFYGIPDLTKYPLETVKIPMLAQFGEHDHAKGFSCKESALNLEKAAKAAGLNFRLHLWNAGHSFMNQSFPERYNPDVAKAALEETADFFRTAFA